jgi:secreted trypsin-like serine protease
MANASLTRHFEDAAARRMSRRMNKRQKAYDSLRNAKAPEWRHAHGDSGAPTFFDGEDGHGAQVIDIASDGNADCATGDVRARVDTPDVRAWIFDTIAARLGD